MIATPDISRNLIPQEWEVLKRHKEMMDGELVRSGSYMKTNPDCCFFNVRSFCDFSKEYLRKMYESSGWYTLISEDRKLIYLARKISVRCYWDSGGLDGDLGVLTFFDEAVELKVGTKELRIARSEILITDNLITIGSRGGNDSFTLMVEDITKAPWLDQKDGTENE